MKSKESAYQAWLGYYNSNKSISRDKARLVRLAEEFSQSMGLKVPPAIPKLILRKMGPTRMIALRVTMTAYLIHLLRNMYEMFHGTLFLGPV